MKQKQTLNKMIFSAFFMALAYVLPWLTAPIPAVGKMLCPMHIPVLLCGFLCGWQWGLAVGGIVPLLRSLTLGAPVFFPEAICMSLELAAYGAIAGLLFRLLPRKRGNIYLSLISAMLIGRLIWGGAMLVCMLARGGDFGWGAFLSGAFLNAIPGIVIQILLIPVLVARFTRTDEAREDRFC